MRSSTSLPPRVLVVGAGPAGLMAAEALQALGAAVQVFEAMPSAGRKLLRAGIGGLNLTHAEPLERFVARYFEREPECGRWLARWGPQDLRIWAAGLGIDTFVGSSQRVFPVGMKAAPLLRAWLNRLKAPHRGVPVLFSMRHRWTGTLRQVATPKAYGSWPHPCIWQLDFHSPAGLVKAQADAVVFALGGGSWAKLGSDGAWVPHLMAMGVSIEPLESANCGFDVRGVRGKGWSDYFRTRFAGMPLKGVVLSHISPDTPLFVRKGELVITQTGLEGSLVYSASKGLRQAIVRHGSTQLELNLKPDWSLERICDALRQPRGKRTLSYILKSKLGLAPVHIALLHELLSPEVLGQPQQLARAIARLPIDLTSPRPIDEAISTAGGVRLEALTPDLMIQALPGVFVAGEMLDWEAPTGGYLLTACMASGRMAGQGAWDYLQAPLA